MAYACEVGFFTAAGATGDQAVTLADSGLTPKSVELFTVGRTVAAPLVGANTVASHGYGTRRGGSTQQVVHSFMSLDAASTSQPSGLCNTGFILRGLTPNASTVVEAYAATLVSFGAGTFTINWSNVVDTASQRVMYIVRGGSDITDALAFSLAGNNSATQNVDLSALTGGSGWTGKPDLVHLAHGSSGGLTNGVTGAYAFSQAIFNQSQSGYATMWLEDGADENVVGDQRSNGPVVMGRSGTSGGDPVIDQATVSAAGSWPTNGFQLAWSLTATLGMVGLAHQGTFQTNIDVVASATSITTVDETASFDPVETYVWGLNMPATASTITADNTAQWGGYGIGAFDGTHQGYGGFTEDDAAATSATGQHWSETSGLRSIDAGGTPVVQGAATISHPGSGVSRFSWTDADNVDRSYLILQVGSASGGGGPTQQEAGGTASVAATATGAATAQSERTASAVTVFGATGAATARTAATGSAAVTVTAAGAATAQPQPAGTAAVTVGATGAATATSRPTGTAAVSVTAAASATARTQTSGSAAVTIAASGAATASTRAAGASSVTVGATGTATVPGQVSATGTAAISTTASGAATARTAAAGTASITTAATGTARATRQASGQATVSVTASGAASTPNLVSAAGIAAITVSTVADATVRVIAAGTAAATFTATGDASILGREAVIFAPLPPGRIIGGQPGSATHRGGGFIAGPVPGPAGGGTSGELVGASRGRVHTSGVKP